MIAGVVDNGDNLSPEPLIRECEMSMDAPFLAVPMTLSATVSNFSGWGYRRSGLN